MLEISMALVCLLFSAFVLLDIVSLMPRLSGSLLGLNGLGFSFTIIANTVKRVFVVLFPPAIGVVALHGSPEDVFRTIFLSHFSAFFVFIVSYRHRYFLFSYFCSTIKSYSSGHRLFSSILRAHKYRHACAPNIDLTFSIAMISFRLLPAALWIFFFYAASGFMINIFAILAPRYSIVILQLTGAINALGTLALAFYLDPKVTRIYERGEQPQKVYMTLFSAQFLNICVFSPLFYLIISCVVL